jgi:hypothetical protein
MRARQGRLDPQTPSEIAVDDSCLLTDEHRRELSRGPRGRARRRAWRPPLSRNLAELDEAHRRSGHERLERRWLGG